MKLTTKEYEITLTREALGTRASGDVGKNIIEDQAPTPEVREKEAAMDEETIAKAQEAAKEKMTTLMFHDAQGYFIKDHQFMGFLRAAGEATRFKYSAQKGGGKGAAGKWTAVSTRLPLYCRIEDEKMYIQGIDTDTKLELTGRSLRARTLQGDRVAWVQSETVPRGVKFNVRITLQDDAPITWPMIEEIMEQGSFVGLLQWRNAGYGRFEWKPVTK